MAEKDKHGSESHGSQERKTGHQERRHQTSINAIMGPGPEWHPPADERTRLLGGSSDSQTRMQNGTDFGTASLARESAGRIGFFSQVWLLLWKNFLQQKRSVWVSVAECAIPLLGAIIMLAVRQIVKVDESSFPKTWTPQGLDRMAAGNLTDRGTYMLYAPNSTLINSMMADINATMIADGLGARTMGFKSEDDIISFYRLNGGQADDYPITVIFDIDSSETALPSDLTYKIRPRTGDDDKWWTQQVFPFYQQLSPREDEKQLYYKRGFLYTQRIISEVLIKQWGSVTDLGASSWQIHRIPYPAYVKDAMQQVLQQNFPVVIMLSFILSVIIMSKNIVYEKERQLKESMKLMGMSAAAHWTAWFLQFFIYLLVVNAVYTLFLSIGLGGKKAVLVFSDPSLMFVFLLLYSVCIISYCFLVSTFVSKANVAAAIAGILFFAVFFPFYFLEQRYEDMALGEKLGVCVLFNMAMAYGMKTIGLYEGTGKGAQWDNFIEPASVDDNFSLLHAMMMLVIDSAICFILTWYLDNVRPGTFGVPRPWYFPFQSSYWCGGGRKRSSSVHEQGGNNTSKFFEREPAGLPVGIRMVHLRKQFAKNKVAVEDSTLTMFEGQITVLLGHNGAGKTTTMSMLTGFLPPSSGTAFVNGFDIRTDINNVRSNLGLCPQHNILFDTLTVDEHLTFFARLKGCPKHEIKAAVAAMALEVGLQTKRSAFAKTLSGGQKRKLSVGIALIGGSKIVVLDEPTSGMDPAARRQTWDVLQRHRAGRTLLLSTHFMDEADLLGDRIAIMAEGVVKCCGTSMFLKKLFGAGYHLVLVKGPQCDISAVTAVVQREVTGAQLESEIGAELSYLLPEVEASKFAQLFQVIEAESQKLGITSFGASATTMEEVFLKVGASGTTEEEESTESATALNNTSVSNGINNPNYSADSSVEGFSNIKQNPASTYVKMPSGPAVNGGAMNGAVAPDTVIDASKMHATAALDNNYTRLSAFSLDLSRFWGMFVKKAIHTRRNRIISAVQLALPVIFTIAALTVDKVRPKDGNDPPRTMNLGMFDGSISAYSTGINATGQSAALGANYSTLFSGDDTVEQINRSRYANISDYFIAESGKVGIFTYNKKVVISAGFEPVSGGSGVTATAWYSGQPFHAGPISLAFLMNTFAQQVTGDSHTITTINHPLPKAELAAARDDFATNLVLGFSIGFSMLFGMTFLTASFCHFIIRERQTGAKHLQVVSGVGPFAFWVASFAWDFVNYMVPCLVLLVVFAAFQVEAYTEDAHLVLVLLLLVVFGLAVIPFVYILQFGFNTPATGFVVLIILAIVSGLFTMMTVFIMRIPSLGVEDVAKVLDWIFMAIFPHYSMGIGFQNLYVNYLDKDYCTQFFDSVPDPNICQELKMLGIAHPCCKDNCADFCLPFESNFLSWEYPGIGRNVLFMCMQCLLFFALTLTIEFQLPQKLAYLIRGNTDMQQQPSRGVVNPQGTDTGPLEDSDVQLERQRVEAGGAAEDTLILNNLYKQYGTFLAVDQISVGVPEQECFGLLGQNGAGKTTTFKMLTGDVMVTSGNASVRHHSIKTDIKKVQANMGYCPQFDALIDQMTGRETLTMYARLRGVPSTHIRRIVDNLITLLMLEPHADKLTMFYSGGNKRKLSTAISLVGGPAVILLDEPSSGMDPGARRQLWNVLSQVRASGRTLILTSHSMEECDALCTRIAIMVNGQFKCLGSPQHLKSKFGQGYTLVAKMAIQPDGRLAPSEPLVETIFRSFPGTQKFDDHQGYVHFQVPDASIPLSQVFATMEMAKAQLGIEDYSVHQTTLEQIFLTFTRAQYPPREVRPKSVIARICPCCS